MKIYIVLYEKYTDKETVIIGAYRDESKANNRVRFERDLLELNQNEKFRDECWYQEFEVVS